MIAFTRTSRLKSLLAACALMVGCSSETDPQQQAEADPQQQAPEPLDPGQPTAATTVQLPQAVANSAVIDDRTVRIAANSADHTSVQELIARIDAYRRKSAEPQPVYFFANRAESATSDDGTIDVNAGNPFGVACKAVGYRYEDDTLILETEPASLEQVIGDADLGGQIVLEPEAVEPHLGTAKSGSSPLPKLPRIDLTGKELYNGDLGVIKLGPTFVDAEATIDYALKVKTYKLRSAHLAINGHLTTQVAIEAQLAKGFEQTFEREAFTTHLALPPAGPVALSLRASIKIGCRVLAQASVKGKIGFNAAANATVGFDFQRDREPRLQGIGDLAAPTYELTEAQFDPEGHAEIYCYIEPRFSVLYFASVGPYSAFRTGVDMQFNAPPPNLRVDLNSEGEVGGEVRLFSFELANFNVPVFDRSKTVYDGFPNMTAGEN